MRRLAGLFVSCVAAAAMMSCAPGGKTIIAEFADVGDLVVRADVQQSDADVGTITNIELVDRGGAWVGRVTMALEAGTPVPEGTTALVRSTSLLGEKFVALIPPEDTTAATPEMPDGGVIPVERTGNVPELEQVFRELGGILASGALEDLNALTSSLAVIVEGQEETIGRVFDGTARLAASLASQREAIAIGLDHLASASETLAGGTDVLTRFLETSDGALRVLASQRQQLADLITQLGRLGAVSADLMREHRDDTSAQIRALIDVIDRVHEARGTLEQAVMKLPAFTELFARAAPGDYIQLDILVEGMPPLPLGGSSFSAAARGPQHLSDVMWSATR